MNDKLLKQIELFQSLTDEEMEQITQKMIVKQYKKNETILYEEDTNRFMYIIISGKTKAVRTTEEGKEIILAIHKSGSFFGEMSLIDGKTVPASVIATEDALIAILAKKDFFSIVFFHKKVAGNLLTILSTRLRRCWDTIQLLNFIFLFCQLIRILFIEIGFTIEHFHVFPHAILISFKPADTVIQG